VFQAAEEAHPFNPYVEALETLRAELELHALDFYRDLLRTPLRSRPTYVFELRIDLPDHRRREFVETFARAHTILRGRP
jgi:hypothetical protein